MQTSEPTGITVPFVSVVLPVRNEARFIGRCLEAVLAQDYPSDRLEVIVADGMSTDDTRAIAESFKARHSEFRVIANTGQIVSPGLNAAIAHARGEIIVRVDGHCEIAPDYVSRCVQHLRNGADAVGGPLETIGETRLARAIATAMSSRFGVGNAAFRTSTGTTMDVDTVAFPAYTRAILDKLGPFDEELVRNQDDEYNYRLRKSGGRILLAADVRSKYFSRSSVRSVAKQYFQYGYWKARVLQKHPRQMSLRQFVPPLFVAVLLVLSIASLFAAEARWILGGLAALYLTACVMAAASLCKRDARIFLWLPVIFAALHLGYGVGFLTGLVRFHKRWGDHHSAIATRSHTPS